MPFSRAVLENMDLRAIHNYHSALKLWIKTAKQRLVEIERTWASGEPAVDDTPELSTAKGEARGRRYRLTEERLTLDANCAEYVSQVELCESVLSQRGGWHPAETAARQREAESLRIIEYWENQPGLVTVIRQIVQDELRTFSDEEKKRNRR
jgi:hypothetical protein